MTDRLAEELRGHDLNLFVVFAAIMEERSVTRAADRLHMSQAAVSAALARLRRAQDDVLFIRTAGGVAPTLRAQRMYGPVNDALRAMRSAVGGAQVFDSARDRFQLTIGMSDDIEAVLMPQVLSSVSPSSPGLSLYCVQTTRHKVSDMLEAGKADLGVTAFTAWGNQFRYRPLWKSRYACVYDPSAVGHHGPIGFEEYLALPHVMISFDGTRGIVDDLLEAHGHTRRCVVSTAHFAMAPFLLKRAAAVATMPRHVAEVYGREFGLVVCDPPLDFPQFEVAAVWHQARDSDPRVGWVVSALEGLGPLVSPAGGAA